MWYHFTHRTGFTQRQTFELTQGDFNDRRWLCPEYAEIVQFCDENGLETDWAFTVGVPVYDNEFSSLQLVSSYDGTDFHK